MKFMLLLPLLLLLFTLGTQAHPRVLLIGLDGLNPTCIKDTHFFHEFIETGSFTYQAKATYEAWSATGWSALLCSLDSTDTGILDNSWVPTWLQPEPDNGEEKISSIEGQQPLKCIFEVIKTQKSHYRTGFYYDWDWLSFFGNQFIPGSFIDDEYPCVGSTFEYCDSILRSNFMYRLSEFPNSDFEFFFLYLGAIDEAGHNRGWCGEEYMQAIESIDSYLRQVMEKFKEIGIYDETIFILTSDHGASIGAFNHGEQNDQNLYIPFYVMGPGIRKNYEIKGNVHLVDVAPTVMKLLKLKKWMKWRGSVVPEIFESLEDGFLEKCD